MIFHLSRHVARILCAIAPCGVFCILSAPLHSQSGRPYKPATVVMTGEFREDGSCQIFADGTPVFSPSDSAVTSYIRGATVNVAPAGFDAHEIWCAPRSEDRPMPPLDARERSFVMMIFPPAGMLAEPKVYEMRMGLPSVATASSHAGGALFGVSPQIKSDSMPIRIGMVYLVATQGTLTITSATENRIVGKFVARAQPTLSM